MERLGYVIVPRNREGMVGQMAGNADADDLLFFPFTKEEMDAAKPLMRAFEQAFGFDAEGNTVEQLIDTRFAGLAQDMARSRVQAAASEAERVAAGRIAEALDAALQTGSYAEFAFR